MNKKKREGGGEEEEEEKEEKDTKTFSSSFHVNVRSRPRDHVAIYGGKKKKN